MKKIINKLIRAIKKFPKSAFYLFGGPPARYWGWLLVFLGVTLVGIITFDVYFFISTNNIISAEVILSEERRPLVVDRSDLAEAVKVIEKREKEYADVLVGPSLADPAL